MKIIITGVAGFVGSNLAIRLLSENHEVIGFDNFITSAEKNLAKLTKFNRFSFYKKDVIDPVNQYLEVPQIDWIMHFASPASPPKYLKHPIPTLRVNSEGTYHLLELSRKLKAKFFLASTSEVYGDPEVHPQPESYWGRVNPNGPRSVYDESKRFAESLTNAYYTNFNLPIRIIRIFNTYGPGMSLTDGRIVTNFIIQALTNQPITIYGDGRQTRSLQYIDDLIEGIVRLMKVDYYQPVNLGNTEEYCLLEIVQIIKEITGSISKIEYFPLPTDDPKRRKPDITLAKKILDWEPKIPLKKGLEKMIDWTIKELAVDASQK